MSLPFAFLATPEEPVRCSFCGELRERRACLEDTCRPDFPPNAGVVTVILCESCHISRHSYAFTDLSYRQHPELLPPEART